MEQFKNNYESLTSKLDGNVNLSAVLDFITYFRTDDIRLYNEFLKDYKEVGMYNTEKLVELYCKSNNVELNDENANGIFCGLLDNIWNNGVAFHLTTSVSALNIYENGMDPSKKESEVMNDINSVLSVLSDYGKKCFFPFARDDFNKYSYSSIPKLNVRYGKAPEWYLNIVGSQQVDFNDIMKKILPMMRDESSIAREKMFNLVSKYHELYKDTTRTMVIIPGLNKQIPPDMIDSFDIHSVGKLNEYVGIFLSIRRRNIDAKSEKVVPSSDLMFINTSTKSMVNYSENDKKV